MVVLLGLSTRPNGWVNPWFMGLACIRNRLGKDDRWLDIISEMSSHASHNCGPNKKEKEEDSHDSLIYIVLLFICIRVKLSQDLGFLLSISFESRLLSKGPTYAERRGDVRRARYKMER